MAKPGKLGFCSEVDEVKKGRGDARIPPLDMEDDKEWPDFSTRKMGMRHGGGAGPGHDGKAFDQLGGEK